MSYKYISTTVAAAFLVTCFVVPLAAHAGDIIRPDARSDFQWKSTECAQPIPPAASSGSTPDDRLTIYARDIQIYIDCIQREAQRDFAEAQQNMQAAIERDLEKKTDTMNEMIMQAAKTMR